jgi:hypothetical protein
MKKIWALVVPSKGIIDFFDLEESRDGSERMNRISELTQNSFSTKDITENKKVKLGSLWDPNTSSFSESDDERSITGKYHFAIIQDNTVKTIIKVWTEKRYDLWKAAELEGVIAVDVTEMEYSALKVGMSWDGTNFTE